MNSPIDPKEIRKAFGNFLTGVTVVTAMGENKPVGFTANSFTPVSLDPPLLLVCPAKSLSSFSVFNTCEYFAVNILSEKQQHVSNIFSSSSKDRFEQIEWTQDQFFNPIIQESATVFICSVFNRVEAGDHIILMGKVLTFSFENTGLLGFSNRGYFSFDPDKKN